MQSAVTSSTVVSTESDHTLYAGWKSNTYTVTLSGDATTTAGTESVVATYGLAMPSITVPTRTGYTFGGYYTGGNGEGTQYYNSDGTSARNWDITADTILIAKWTAQSVTVTLDQQSGSGGTTSITATYGNAMPSITLPTRSGYAFAGYFTSTGGGGTQYYTSTGGSSRKWDQTADKTLYAYWISLSAKAFSYTGGIQSYTIPVAGIYKLEVWGAGGGNADSSAGGKGGYSCGYVKLAAGKTVYIGVGGKGTNPNGGYNGGGNAVADSSVTYRGGGGGGATHMALQSGTLASIGSANASKILLVAGGGGGAGKWAISADDDTSRAGGNGGGTNGANGTDGGSNGATATSGAAFGQGGSGGSDYASSRGGGGGGGFYGGRYTNQAGGGGGSGYIGGVASFTYGGTTYSPSTTTGSGNAAATNGKAQITFVKAIDEADTLPTEWRYFHTGGVQTFQANKTGVYKLETWGAGGGSAEEAGGKGGYSSGYIKLTAGDTLYIVVGGRGTNPNGGYNGGGNAVSDSSVTYRGGGGGGATHIAKVTGTISSIGSSNLSQILLIAGGGGGAGKWAISADDDTSRAGGNGGGTNGANGTDGGSNGATATSGAAFGQGGSGGSDYASSRGGGGGGGLYGGRYTNQAGGGGGSGYVGGLPSFTYNSVTYAPTTIAGSGSVADGDGSVKISFITE